MSIYLNIYTLTGSNILNLQSVHMNIQQVLRITRKIIIISVENLERIK